MTPQDAIAFLNSDDYESAGYWLAVKTAIEALKKQIPKPMNFVGEFCEMSVMACGSCGKTVGAGDVPGRKFYYCKHYGQKILR